MNIPFSPPYIDEAVINEVTDSLRSGWITTGPKVNALEQEIQKLVNAQKVLCVNSWTTGAIMMLRWLGVKPGDEVIIPAYTYCATALAVLWAGAKPVMVDVNDDFNISIDAIREAITYRTKAIIPVDIAGWPCDYSAIMSLVSEPEIKKMFEPTSPIMEKIGRVMVISDSAHSLGAHYHGNCSGTDTDITIFSLHAVKNITTAEGGAICLNLPVPFDNSVVYKELRLMSLNCQTKDAFTKSKAGGWQYDIVGLGMKANMPDVNAAIGLAQIRQYDKMLAERRRVFNTYNEMFSQFDWAILPPYLQDGCESSCHVYALRIKDISEEQRNAIIDFASKKQVALNVHFTPLPMFTYFKDLGYDMSSYPQAFANYVHEISLPCYPQLDDNKVRFVVNVIRDAYQQVVGR
ncbi:MAG: DegT/DnrJ/EryC1/StrS family aminotransferase [Prevotellaceae bacterium]|nr:DegT/DnrJ/EryC1/StrS family aminotransferase [Prevotellaceae bacterium]